MLLRTLGGLFLEGTELRRPKPLLLLTYLALEGPQERGHLAELFFRGSSKGRASLSTTLSRLRSSAPGAIEADDARVWTGIASDTQQLLLALERGEHDKGAELYRGRFLAGVDPRDQSVELEEWIYATREFIANRVQEAHLALAERDAAQGRFDVAAKRAERAFRLTDTTLEPGTLRRLHPLMLAGNSTYAEQVAKDAIEYGLTPHLSTTLEEAREYLQQLLGALQSSTPHNLFHRDTTFVGRAAELVDIHQLLSEHRLVTLIGMGGTGKSRLALRVASEYLQQESASDGVYFVPLDALTTTSYLPTAIASAMKLMLEGTDEPLTQLQRHLGDQCVLLVLDNFEQLLDAALALSTLLQACANLRLLVTSRERLHLEEEQLYEVEGLSYPTGSDLTLAEASRFDAVQLFLDRARRSNPNLELSGDALEAVLELCRLIEGSPLALELAAAWVRALPVKDLVEELRKSLDVLSTSTRNVPDRHKSIRASFEHSWGLLTPEERQVLGRLAVFRGGFRREAAGEVAGTTIPLLASLVDKSLLRVSPAGRYDRHPLLYHYMFEKLAEDPQEQETNYQKHAQYFLDLTESALPHLNSADHVVWLERLEVEHDNLRAALERLVDRNDAERALRLAIAASEFWVLRGFFEEGRAIVKQALALQGEHNLLKARALSCAGTLAFAQQAFDEAWSLYEQSLEISRELGDKRTLSAALDNLGNIAGEMRGYDIARRLLEESLALRRELGLAGATAWTLIHLSGVEVAQGNLAKARACLEESLVLFRSVSHDQGTAWTLMGLGRLALDSGDYGAARRFFGEALTIVRQIKEPHATSAVLIGLGELEKLSGEHKKAREWLLEGLEVSRRYAMRGSAAWALDLLGQLALAQGEFEQVRVRLHESLEIRRGMNNLWGLTRYLMSAASLAVATGDVKRAVTLWGAAEAMREERGVPLAASWRAEHERELAAARNHLEERSFSRAWQEGRALGFEEAIGVALADRPDSPQPERG